MFFSITVIGAVSFMLDSTRSCGEALNFCNTVIFIMVFTVCMMMLLVLSILTENYKHDSKGGAFRFGSVKFFFLEDINIKQIILIPLGLLAVFLVSYGAILAHNPVLGIFASGSIMMGVFYYGNSAMPVVIIHGAYNALVIYLRSQQLSFLPNFSQSPINVPDISFQIFPVQIINQMLTQMLLVAPAEEIFKIFMVTVFIIIIKLKFNYSGLIPKLIALIISVAIWSGYHLNLNSY